MSAQPRRILLALLAAPVVAGTAAGAAWLADGGHRRLGASDAESAATLPGDELFPAAGVQNDRACTIAATPEQVWPWIAQLGQDRAGFYSFETVENLVGCQITGATRIHPEWQHPAPGDPFRLHPTVALQVAQVAPPRYLVVSSEGGQAPGGMDFGFSWTFHLAPQDGAAGGPVTRLHLRERYETHDRSTRASIEVVSVISAIMTWRMMSRLRSLVGRAPMAG